MAGFLPITKKEMTERGIRQFDFICVTGDAYVDHPSFGIAIISRVLESHGSGLTTPILREARLENGLTGRLPFIPSP